MTQLPPIRKQIDVTCFVSEPCQAGFGLLNFGTLSPMEFNEERSGEWPDAAKTRLRARILASKRIENKARQIMASALLDLWVRSPGAGLTIKDLSEILRNQKVERSNAGIPKLMERLEVELPAICSDVCAGVVMEVHSKPYLLSVSGPTPYWWDTQERKTIGLLVANASDWFTGQLLKGVLKALPPEYGLLIDSSNDRDELESARFRVMVGRCDGLLMVPIEDKVDDESILSTMRLFPSVLVDRYLKNEPSIPSVHHDDFIAGRFAATLLRQRHCRKVWVVQQQSEDRGSQSLTPMTDRVSGCRRGHSKSMAVEVIGARGADEHGGVEALQSVRGRIDVTDGVFATTDRLAIGCRHFLRTLPENQRPDLSKVISFEGQPLGAYIEPPLTSIFADPEVLGFIAARVLLDHIANPEKMLRLQYVVEPKVLPRSTDTNGVAFTAFLDRFREERMEYYAKQIGGTQEQILLVRDASDERVLNRY